MRDITKRKKVVEETTLQATVEEWPQGELPHKKDGVLVRKIEMKAEEIPRSGFVGMT